MGLDNISPEVSKKIKSAIKAKLTELGAYVDDELPDYIMILVGNKKTKDQMDEDLSLFLGQNTEKFTNWLHVVLEKISQASGLQKMKEDKKEITEKADDISPTSPPIEGKKKHKKKKDKSEKKKEKKEKKKKKDKDKDKSSKHKDKSSKNEKDKEFSSDRATKTTTDDNSSVDRISKATLEIVKPEVAVDKSTSPPSPKKETEIKRKELVIERKVAVQSDKDSEVSDEDVIKLKINEDELSLDVEGEIMPKKSHKMKHSLPASREVKNVNDASDARNIKIVISNNNKSEKLEVRSVEKHETRSGEKYDTRSDQSQLTTVYDRLGPLPSSQATKKIINLREESTFPSKSSNNNNSEGIGRVVSSAINSAVRSTIVKPEVRPAKKLEARVRPLLSSSIRNEEKTEVVTDRPSTRLSSRVQKRVHSDDEEQENDEPSAKKLAGSVTKVEVAPRPKRTRNQANSTLILKAVADAHKSVSNSRKRSADDMEEDSHNKKELFTKSYRERQSQRLRTKDEANTINRYAITVSNTHSKEHADEEIDDNGLLVKKAKVISEKDLSLHGDGDRENTRFIVTMDGLENEEIQSDLRTRIRTKTTPSVDEEEFIEEIEEWEEVVEEVDSSLDSLSQTPSSFTQKIKAKPNISSLTAKKEERCRFWPTCKEGSACLYVHPNKLCITFPNCRFGDKCLYIHPKCKFDLLCTKPNCPFQHSTQKALPVAPPVKSVLYKPPVIKCRYYPKCTDMNCPFMHPKQVCRYGKSCQNPSCLFVHPEVKVTTGSLLKWTAPKSTSTTNGTSSIKSSDVPTSSVVEDKKISTPEEGNIPLASA